ncbi:hypothetical protein QLH52_02525 [Methylomonas sp. OY6]|uniref:Uncharacterized protein n=1 Tax=Methylomonas defluvii TaxID=3045149 RepID=A0ABU4U9L9_9GAMM|nr:hypothetical protein [Methylomonas sp. OY6]MDX8126142.1 hypothetical protein [Methylomonas sp. OY6]
MRRNANFSCGLERPLVLICGHGVGFVIIFMIRSSNAEKLEQQAGQVKAKQNITNGVAFVWVEAIDLGLA